MTTAGNSSESRSIKKRPGFPSGPFSSARIRLRLDWLQKAIYVTLVPDT
jgi:hypothetical protein